MRAVPQRYPKRRAGSGILVPAREAIGQLSAAKRTRDSGASRRARKPGGVAGEKPLLFVFAEDELLDLPRRTPAGAPGCGVFRTLSYLPPSGKLRHVENHGTQNRGELHRLPHARRTDEPPSFLQQRGKPSGRRCAITGSRSTRRAVSIDTKCETASLNFSQTSRKPIVASGVDLCW